jgi:hypothetical protein
LLTGWLLLLLLLVMLLMLALLHLLLLHLLECQLLLLLWQLELLGGLSLVTPLQHTQTLLSEGLRHKQMTSP